MLDAITVPLIDTEPVASVLRVLQLEPRDSEALGDDKALFAGSSLAQARRRVYGGQVLGQSMLAAAATVPPNRHVHSLHASFIRSGVFTEEIAFEVALLRDGRSFSSRRVAAKQSAGTICETMFSFQEAQEGLEHHATAPAVPDPESLRSAITLLSTFEHPVSKYLGKTAAFDVRHCEEPIYFQPAPEKSSTQALWMRPRAPIPAGAPQVLHRALLAYVVDQVMLEPVLRTHGLSWFTEGLSLATLDHAQWFFADFDINDWLLFVQSSPASQGGRGLAQCHVFTRDGQEVSSITQEGMVRVPLTEEERAAYRARAKEREGFIAEG